MRMGVNQRRSFESRKATRNERMTTAGRWFVRKGLRLILIPLVFVALIWGAWQGIKQLEISKMIVLKKVEVEGNQLLTWEDVLSAAKVELGVPMLDLKVDSIQAALERLDLVQKAEVKRSIFTTLRIRIVEAKPLFLVSDPKGWKMYSDKGTRIPIRQDLGMQLPVVSAGNKTDLAKAVKLLCTMRDSDAELFAGVSQLVVNSAQSSLDVYFRNVGHKVLFSANTDAIGFHRYKLLVQSLSKNLQGAVVVDMRFPGFAVARVGNRENQDG